MKRTVRIVIMVGALLAGTACNLPPTIVTRGIFKPGVDRTLRWECHVPGSKQPVYMNDEGRSEMPPSLQAKCTPIKPVPVTLPQTTVHV